MKFKHFVVGILASTLGLTILTQDAVLIAQDKPATTGETREQTNPSGTQTDNLPSRGVNNRTSPPPAPPKKGGSNTRGGAYPCQISFNNTTPWFIDLYVNNDFVGTIAPYGDAVVPATAGGFRLFGRSEFQDRSVSTWGPQAVSLRPGDTYRWTLTP